MGKIYNPIYKKKYYKKNKKRISDYWKVFYANNRERLKKKSAKRYWEKLPEYLFYAAKDRAKRAGIPFNITKYDVVVPKVCPVFKRKFIPGDRDWTPSLDKIVPSKGYVKGNIAVMSFKANRMKHNNTKKDLKRLLAWLVTVC